VVVSLKREPAVAVKAEVGVVEVSPALATSAQPSAATVGAVKVHDSTKSSLVWLEQSTGGDAVV